jgi:hypothetical protein
MSFRKTTSERFPAASHAKLPRPNKYGQTLCEPVLGAAVRRAASPFVARNPKTAVSIVEGVDPQK